MLFLLACTGPRPPHVTDDSQAPVVYTEAQVEDLQWSLNEEIASVVHVSWTQTAAAEAWVEFRFEGEDWIASPPREEEGAAEQLVLGVPYDMQLELRVVNDFGEGPLVTETVTAQTGPIPETVPVPVAGPADATKWTPGANWMLLGVSEAGEGWRTGDFWKLIVDRQGRVVWAHLTPDGHRTWYMAPSTNGEDILWDQNTFWTDFDQGQGSRLHRMKLDGSVSEEIPVPGMHHTWIELEEGVIVWGGLDEDNREVLRERQPDGTVRQIWDCEAWWYDNGAHEQCDGNGLYWDQESDTIWFSSDVHNTVVELNRDTGEVLTIFGELDGSWELAEGSSGFFKQHSPTLPAEGRFMVSSHTTRQDHDMVAREYAMDEAGQVLEEVWTCGPEPAIRADFAGNAHRLEGGNTLLNYGGGGALREVTPECETVWEIDWTEENMTTLGTFLEDLYDFAP